MAYFSFLVPSSLIVGKVPFPPGLSPLSFALIMSRVIILLICNSIPSHLDTEVPGNQCFWHLDAFAQYLLSTSRWHSPGISWKHICFLHLSLTQARRVFPWQADNKHRFRIFSPASLNLNFLCISSS